MMRFLDLVSLSALRRGCAAAGLGAAFCLAPTSLVHAVSLETQNNPVPNGVMQMNGDYSKWLSVPQYQLDTFGDGASGGLADGVDIAVGAVAHDENNIYFMWRNVAGGVTTFSNWIWVNMDNDPATGRTDMFGLTAPLARGAEYNLGGLAGFNQWAGADGGFTGGAAGMVSAAGSSTGTGAPDFIEWSISRTAEQPGGLFFNPTGGTTLEFVYVTESGAPDLYPNVPSSDWFTYDTAGVYDPGVPGDADGNGIVDINDYLVIQANSFTTVLFGQLGDVDDNGFVDFDDFDLWKNSFPGGPEAAEAAIAALVPEASSLALACGAALGLCFRRKRAA